jgi:hypothetical protein
MPDRFVESHIQRLPMFQYLKPEELDLVVKAFQVLRFQTGEFIVKEGNATQGLFIVVNGSVRLLQAQPDGKERPVGILDESQVYDHHALFSTSAERASLQAAEPAILLFLSRQRMNTVLSYYPEVRSRLVMPPYDTPGQPQPASPQRQTSTSYAVQRDDEEIILIRRRHPWAFVRRGGWALLLLVMGIAGTVAITMSTLPVTLALIPAGFGFVLAALLMTYFYMEWRNDSFVITDSRVIHIERVIPTFSVRINEMPLDRVQEVNTELPEGDLFARIFDYGDVELKNAADAGDMVLDTIPHPDIVQEAIFANQSRRREIAEQNKRSVIRADIERHLGLDKTAVSESINRATQEVGAVVDPAEAPQRAAKPREWSLSPARMRFINQDGDTVIRKHVTIWLAAIFMPLVLVTASAVLFVTSIAAANTLGILGRFGLLAAPALLVIGGLWFWWADWDWRNDMYIISDDRVTLIHRRPLWLQNEVDQVLLNRVDNVVSETSGFVDTFFRRGDVNLSLVGEGIENAKRFVKVHKPHEIQSELSRRQARAKMQRAAQDEQRQREAITEYLSVYHETVGGQGGAQPQAQQPPAPDVSPNRSPSRQRPPRVPRRRD